MQPSPGRDGALGSAPAEPHGGVALRRLGRQPYEPVWRAMQAYTAGRGADGADEAWLTEHDPVYTLGQAGDPSHVLDAGTIPLVKVDRGGQVTYHGPGQAVLYLMLDLRRRGIGVRSLVSAMEQAVLDFLMDQGFRAELRPGAPGVYVAGAKIAALGLRVRHGCTYHGLSFNVDMDLTPFSRINPCGYEGLPTTQARDLGIRVGVEEAGLAILDRLLKLIPPGEPA